MDEYLKRKKEIEETISNYKLAFAFRSKQTEEMIRRFPFTINWLPDDVNIMNKIRVCEENLAIYISETPVEPGKFLELPNDCFSIIAGFFRNLEQFKTFSLVSKQIRLDQFIFKNIEFDTMPIKHGKWRAVGDGYCNLNHGILELTGFRHCTGEIHAFGNVVSVIKIGTLRKLFDSIIGILGAIKGFNMPIVNIKSFHRLLSKDDISDMIKLIKYHKINNVIKLNKHDTEEYCIEKLNSVVIDDQCFADINDIAKALAI